MRIILNILSVWGLHSKCICQFLISRQKIGLKRLQNYSILFSCWLDFLLKRKIVQWEKIRWTNTVKHYYFSPYPEAAHLHKVGDKAVALCRAPDLSLIVFSLPDCQIIREVALPNSPGRPLENDELDQVWIISFCIRC